MGRGLGSYLLITRVHWSFGGDWVVVLCMINRMVLLLSSALCPVKVGPFIVRLTEIPKYFVD